MLILKIKNIYVTMLDLIEAILAKKDRIIQCVNPITCRTGTCEL